MICLLDMTETEMRDNESWQITKSKRKISSQIYTSAFAFPEHHEKTTYGFGYTVTLTKNSDNFVLNKDNATNIGKIKIISIVCYLPHYSPSFPEQALLAKQVLSKLHTELEYLERSVFLNK